MLYKVKAKYKNDTMIFEVYVPQGEKEEAIAKAREIAKRSSTLAMILRFL
jgi:hypothetical protein